MGGGRIPGPVGRKPNRSGVRASSLHPPRPLGTGLRLPTLEVFTAINGGALSTRAHNFTRAEIALARPIFGESIFYDAVRIVVGSIANAPTTLGNFVRISPRHEANGLPNAMLLHELTRVWQFQTRGPDYVSNSLCA